MEPPNDFSATQKAIWRDAIASAPPGVLRPSDTSVLCAWVAAFDTHSRLRVEVSREETTVRSVNRVVVNPKIAALNRQAAILTRCATELGFSPTARPRLSTAPAAAPRELGPDGRPRMSLDEYIASAPPIPTVKAH